MSKEVLFFLDDVEAGTFFRYNDGLYFKVADSEDGNAISLDTFLYTRIEDDSVVSVEPTCSSCSTRI